jgi:hypothetical protein
MKRGVQVKSKGQRYVFLKLGKDNYSSTYCVEDHVGLGNRRKPKKEKLEYLISSIDAMK